LRTSGGNISVGRALGPTELRTSGGGIRIKSAEGTLLASTSGGSIRAEFAGAIKGNCDLRTSGGNVEVAVDRPAGFNLDAATSGGGVEVVELPIAIERGAVGKSHIAGAVNGGGAVLKLRTSGGNIRVAAR
jgi:DUF4097 and DUF4098 domain-containing protein YvlB